MGMMRRGRSIALVVALGLALTACAADDGGQVRDLGSDGSATGSGSGSGSASASGTASGSASASGPGSATGSASGSAAATSSDGGYEYATDVSAHRLVTLDVCEIKELLDGQPIDFTAIDRIYRDGSNSVNEDGSVRTLAGFATSEDRLHGLADYYGTPVPLDDFVSGAIEGEGLFSGASEAARAQGVEKGIQNQIMVAWVIHELEAALQKASEGDFDPQAGAVHNWDEAWSFYHGAEPGCAPHATADSRASDFGTLGSDGATAETNEQILAAMTAGRDGLLASDAAAAEAAAEEIRRAIFVTYSQAAIRYATLAARDVEGGDVAAASAHRAEGLAFWRVIEAIAARAGGEVDTVNAIFDPAAGPGTGGGEEVREALVPAWEALGIAEEDIGRLR